MSVHEARAVGPALPPAQAARINNTADGAKSFNILQRGGIFLLSILSPIN